MTTKSAELSICYRRESSSSKSNTELLLGHLWEPILAYVAPYTWEEKMEHLGGVQMSIKTGVNQLSKHVESLDNPSLDPSGAPALEY